MKDRMDKSSNSYNISMFLEPKSEQWKYLQSTQLLFELFENEALKLPVNLARTVLEQFSDFRFSGHAYRGFWNQNDMDQFYDYSTLPGDRVDKILENYTLSIAFEIEGFWRFTLKIYSMF